MNTSTLSPLQKLSTPRYRKWTKEYLKVNKGAPDCVKQKSMFNSIPYPKPSNTLILSNCMHVVDL